MRQRERAKQVGMAGRGIMSNGRFGIRVEPSGPHQPPPGEFIRPIACSLAVHYLSGEGGSSVVDNGGALFMVPHDPISGQGIVDINGWEGAASYIIGNIPAIGRELHLRSVLFGGLTIRLRP